MKYLFSLMLITTIAMASCAQDIPSSKVPSVVQNAVQIKYPAGSKIEWEKKNDMYEAEFSVNKVEHTVLIDAAGKLIHVKTEVAENEVPSAILAAIKRDHADYKIDEIEKIDKNGMISYEVELEKKGEKDKKLIFSPDGNQLQNSTSLK